MFDCNTVTTRAALAKASVIQAERPSSPIHQSAESNQNFQEQRLDIQRWNKEIDNSRNHFSEYMSNHLVMAERPIIREALEIQNLLKIIYVEEAVPACTVSLPVLPIIGGLGYYPPDPVVSIRSINSRPTIKILITLAIPNYSRLKTFDAPQRLSQVYSEVQQTRGRSPKKAKILRVDHDRDMRPRPRYLRLLPPCRKDDIQAGHEERLAREFKDQGHYYPRQAKPWYNTKFFRQIDEHLRLRGAKPLYLLCFSISEPLVELIRAALPPVGWTIPLFTHFSRKSDLDPYLIEFRTLMILNDMDEQHASIFKQCLKD